MRRTLIVVIVLSAFTTAIQARDRGVEWLIAESDPGFQEQIKRAYSAFFEGPAIVASGIEFKSNCGGFLAIEALKDLTNDKDEIVKQLAIFTVTTTSEEDTHVMGARLILDFLDLPPSVPIRVLAPYLDTENPQLRLFARSWFQYHDSSSRTHGLPPLGSVNYYDYMSYVRSRISRGEEIPAAFIEFIYERHPGKALLVFAYANQAGDVVAQLHDIRKHLEAARQGQEKTPEEIHQQREEKRQHEIRKQGAKIERSEILLAEHIVSNAIWLNKNGFAEQFQKALPEATAELAKLAKHKEWWARLYVAWIMRQHPELRQADV